MSFKLLAFATLLASGCESRTNYPVSSPLTVTELPCTFATDCQGALSVFIKRNPSERVTSLVPLGGRGILVSHTRSLVPYARLEDTRVIVLRCKAESCRDEASTFAELYPDATVWAAFPSDLPTDPAYQLIALLGPRVEQP